MKRHLSLQDLPKRPHGHCRWCGQPVPKGRRRWCGDVCVNEYLVRAQGGYAARKVFERDRGICALCGLDTVALRAIARQALLARPKQNRERAVLVELDGRQYEVPIRFPWGQNPDIRHLWEADHIVPVAENGGACGLAGLRTLCYRCHAQETGKLRRRLNARKRDEVMMTEEQ